MISSPGVSILFYWLFLPPPLLTNVDIRYVLLFLIVLSTAIFTIATSTTVLCSRFSVALTIIGAAAAIAFSGSSYDSTYFFS